jgi:hypothetical protein
MGVITTKSTGANKIVFMNMRGASVGGTNLYTTIGLANNATTSFHTIQGVAGTGGWISGTIVIDATTDYVIPFLCFFDRQRDGTTYNVSAQFGDSIPTGLSITNSSSSIQVVMPNNSGFVSASVTYCVQAAANGTTLPVSLSASSVLGSTSGSEPSSGVIGEKISSTTMIDTAGSTTAGTKTTVKTTGGVTSAALTLTAGIWNIYWGVSQEVDVSVGAGLTGAIARQELAKDDGTLIETAEGPFANASAVAARFNPKVTTRVIISESTTYNIKFYWSNNSGTATVTTNDTYAGALSSSARFYAVRIG